VTTLPAVEEALNNSQEIQNGLTELRRGVTTLAVLLSLRVENHGYAVRLMLAKMGLPLKEGTLYPLLRRLESQGILSGRWDSTGDRMRKYYSLTDLGRETLGTMRQQWGHLINIVDKVDAGDPGSEPEASFKGGMYEPV
jgi:PadR family transcriptional regulator, regulatory protein PadR